MTALAYAALGALGEGKLLVAIGLGLGLIGAGTSTPLVRHAVRCQLVRPGYLRYDLTILAAVAFLALGSGAARGSSRRFLIATGWSEPGPGRVYPDVDHHLFGRRCR
jgi:hypothetical protein